MSPAAKSVFYFGIYILFTGMLLVFMPNALLRLVQVPAANEVWIHLAGMLLIFMGFFYIQAGRKNMREFFKWTLITRTLAGAFVSGFVLTGLISPVILFFWSGDLLGALWTYRALRAERTQ